MNAKAVAIILSAFLSVISNNCAFAVPANQITIPNNPGFDMKTGLAASETDAYKREIEETAARAKKFCEPFAGKPRVAIVVDIDETILDNREELRKHDYDVKADTSIVWDHSSWDQWVREARAPEIKPTADFVRWAKENHFAVFAITGRDSTSQGFTEMNLIKQRIPFDEVFTKPLGFRGRAEDFKTDYRRLIEARGYTIVCSMGDQESDLYGLHALDCEKMPNKMYFVP